MRSYDVTLSIPQTRLEALAVALDEVEDASRKFNRKVSNWGAEHDFSCASPL